MLLGRPEETSSRSQWFGSYYCCTWNIPGPGSQPLPFRRRVKSKLLSSSWIIKSTFRLIVIKPTTTANQEKGKYLQEPMRTDQTDQAVKSAGKHGAQVVIGFWSHLSSIAEQKIYLLKCQHLSSSWEFYYFELFSWFYSMCSRCGTFHFSTADVDPIADNLWFNHPVPECSRVFLFCCNRWTTVTAEIGKSCGTANRWGQIVLCFP